MIMIIPHGERERSANRLRHYHGCHRYIINWVCRRAAGGRLCSFCSGNLCEGCNNVNNSGNVKVVKAKILLFLCISLPINTFKCSEAYLIHSCFYTLVNIHLHSHIHVDCSAQYNKLWTVKLNSITVNKKQHLNILCCNMLSGCIHCLLLILSLNPVSWIHPGSCCTWE